MGQADPVPDVTNPGQGTGHDRTTAPDEERALPTGKSLGDGPSHLRSRGADILEGNHPGRGIPLLGTYSHREVTPIAAGNDPAQAQGAECGWSEFGATGLPCGVDRDTDHRETTVHEPTLTMAWLCSATGRYAT